MVSVKTVASYAIRGHGSAVPLHSDQAGKPDLHCTYMYSINTCSHEIGFMGARNRLQKKEPLQTAASKKHVPHRRVARIDQFRLAGGRRRAEEVQLVQSPILERPRSRHKPGSRAFGRKITAINLRFTL